MVSELLCHLKSMLTFTLPLAKPCECIKSCIHSRPIFQALFLLSFPSCAKLERDRDACQGGSEEAHRQRSTETRESLLWVVSGKC